MAGKYQKRTRNFDENWDPSKGPSINDVAFKGEGGG